MKTVEQWAARLRARSRALAPASLGWPPDRLVVDLGPSPSLDLAALRRAIVDVVHWAGPIRVVVRSGPPPLEDEALRIAHRLECPTHLLDPGSVDEDRALALVDGGLGAVTVRDRALAEVLLRAANSRHRRLQVQVLDAEAPPGARALSSAALEANATPAGGGRLVLRGDAVWCAGSRVLGPVTSPPRTAWSTAGPHARQGDDPLERTPRRLTCLR